MFIAEEPAEITIDRIDRKILRLLQDDGRISNVALAKRVGLSATATGRKPDGVRRNNINPNVG